MSSKRQKLETEIMKHRNDGNWSKVEETTKLLSKKYGSSDGAVIMLEAEAKLETYLQENPPRRQNVTKSRKDLAHLKNKLQESMASECKDSIFNVKDESCMLLCKVFYAQGNTKLCLDWMKNLNLEKLGKDNPCYRIKFLAEMFATRGLSLEHARLKGTEETSDNEIIEFYERSTELSFEYMAEFDRLQGQGSSCEPPISYGMELAFQRGPLLYLKNNDLETGIEKLRRVLQSKVPSTVQQTLARDLATVLLRGISDKTYKSPLSSQNGDEPEGSKSTKVSLKHGSNSPTATFTISPIDKSLSPSALTQESTLLLIISEAILNTDPLLDMSPEYEEARSELLRDSRTLYDLLAIAIADVSLYDVFSKSIEASLKYAYNEFHIWYQYALALLSQGKYDRAVRVLMECSRIQPEDPAPLLLAAKTCYENLHEIDVGIEYAKKALDAATVRNQSDDDDHSDDYLCAAYIAVGIGHSYQCTDGLPLDKVKEYRSSAILHFEKAHEIDPQDSKPLLFKAVELALDRRINEAIAHVKQALDLQPEELNSLHMLVLLLSAQKHCKQAFAVLEIACKFYPENINLLITKCKLEIYVGKNEDALRTCNQMAHIYKSLHEVAVNNNWNTEAVVDRMTSDGLSVTNQSIGNDLDVVDGGSFIGSVALSRIERALSDIESSLGEIHRRNATYGATNPSVLHGHIWLLTAEVYLALRRFDEAGQCILEASALFPLSHSVLFTRGRLSQCRGDLTDAATLYENAITVNPKHHRAMLEWARILMQQGRYEFAKELLQEAAKLNPMSHEVWLCLGDVLQELGDIEGAVDCMTTSINIEASSPILPFNSIPRDL